MCAWHSPLSSATVLVAGGAASARSSSVDRPCYVAAIVSAHASTVQHTLTAGQVAGAIAVSGDRVWVGGFFCAAP